MYGLPRPDVGEDLQKHQCYLLQAAPGGVKHQVRGPPQVCPLPPPLLLHLCWNIYPQSAPRRDSLM